MNQKINELLKEYTKKENDYKKAYSAFKDFIEDLLNKHGFDYQVLKSRIKSKDSFENKIKNLKNTPSSLNGVDDLLGFRIIFYLRSDIQNFSNLLRNQNDINITKYNLRFSEDNYTATHFVIDFEEYEYKFELQLTTCLYDAWAHINHSCVYKPGSHTVKNDLGMLKKIGNHMKTTMKEHIHRAQLDLDFIVDITEKFRNGQEILHIGLFEELKNETNANIILNRVECIHELLTEVKCKPPKNLNILQVLKNIIERVYSLDYPEIETPLGFLLKKTPKDLIEACLNVASLVQIMFQYPEDFFTLIEDVLDNNKDKIEILKKAIGVGDLFSKYKYYRLKQIGYQPQLFCLQRIEAWSSSHRLKRLDFLIKIISNILDTAFSESELTEYDKCTLTHGALNPCESLIQIRERAINILFDLFRTQPNYIVRQKLLSTIEDATKLPNFYYEDGLITIIESNTRRILNFYIELWGELELDIMFTIHLQIDWMVQRFPNIFNKEFERIKMSLKNNYIYQIFFVIFGYHKRSMKFDDYCNDKFNTYIDNISHKTLSKWIEIFESILKNIGHRDKDFSGFGILLYNLAIKKPKIGLLILKQHKRVIEPFIERLILGLWRSSEKNALKKELRELIKNKKHCREIAHVLTNVDDFDIRVAQSIFSVFKNSNDIVGLNHLLVSLYVSNKKSKTIQILFNNVIEILSQYGETEWVKYCWAKDSILIKALDEDGIALVFENLVKVKIIDYEVEYLLLPIAKKSPLSTIKFFRKRIDYKQSLFNKSELWYEDVPLNFQLLNGPFKNNAEVVIPEILNWFNSEDLLIHKAQRLLQIIFPELHPILETKIEGLIEERKIENVLDILKSYGGTMIVHNVCKRIIEKVNLTKEIKSKLFDLLSFPEKKVMIGEYGTVEHYESKKEEIKSWKDDKTNKIKKFVEEYEGYLNKKITDENNNVFIRIESLKRNFEF